MEKETRGLYKHRKYAEASVSPTRTIGVVSTSIDTRGSALSVVNLPQKKSVIRSILPILTDAILSTSSSGAGISYERSLLHSLACSGR